MRHRTKAIFIVGLAWFLFLALTFIPELRISLPIHTLLGLIIFSITALTLYFLITTTVINTNKAGTKKISQKLNTKGANYTQALERQLLYLSQQYTNSLNEIANLEMQTKSQNERFTENKHIQSAPHLQRESIMRLAHYDELTTLPNRIFFNQILNKAISHVKRRNKILALLLIDIDGFKKINAEMGFAIGDNILKTMASKLSQTLRSEDILARFNGDEFVVLLNDIGKAKFASAVAQKLLQLFKEPIEVEGKSINLTVSIGISIYPNDGQSLEELVKKVDKALSQAKHEGGATYKFYSTAMDVEAHEFIKIEQGLRQALQNQELLLYFQPKMHIKNGNMSGVEALIRWMHPEHGLINPIKFLPVAEDTGLFMNIAEWAITEACKETKFWQTEGYEHLTTSINLSPKQFFHPDIDTIIAKALTETGLSGQYLELEVNEDTVMDNIELAIKQFTKLKKLDVQLTIDHFGIGYTSISHLKTFLINTIKIDRSFIKGIPQNPDDIAITKAFITLAHNLGLVAVAEGVETAEQVQYLTTQDCDIVQGYFLSHPLPAAKVIKQFSKLRDEVLL